MSGHVVMMTTTGGADAARRLATALVEERLAACVQMMDVRSIYRWDGAVRGDDEVLLLIKTRADRQEAAAARIAALHDYETPEIFAAPITFGAASYLAWMDRETLGDAP
jgi:periplasmic divalent cation tolerance protein